MKQHFLIPLTCGLAFASTAVAQTRAVTGRVTDASGTGLPGVTVLERGTTNGTSTDANGGFSLSVQPGATLVLSSIGFETQNVVLGDRTSLPVTLKSNATELGEAVVVGYGSQTKSEVTGSVTQLSSKDVQNVPTVSFEQAIQGRTPGVQINQTSGKLGAGVQIRVRGSSSVTASNQPLYVIDGIPVTSQDVGSDTEPLNPLADLNPNDIESITILKDAASSAIYGSRASNGVVLVTTKQGRQGQTKVNLGYYVGTSETTRRRKFLNAEQYKALFTVAAENEGYDAREEFEGNGLDYDSPYDQSWSDEPFRKGKVSQYDLNVSGGDAKTRFYLSTTFNDQTGIIIGNRYRRGSARINLDHSITEKLRVGLNLSLTRSVNDRTPNDNAFSNPVQLNALPPLQPKIDPATGQLNQNTLYYNNLLDLEKGSNRAGTYRSFSNVNLNYKPIKDLTLRTEAGADFLNLNENIYRAAGTQDGGNTGYGYSNQVQVINYTTNNTATYLKTIGEDHSIEALAGFSFQRSDAQETSAEGRGFPNPEFTRVASAAIKTAGSGSVRDGFSFVSYFARVNYGFQGKYLISGSVRRDGSSRFGANNRYGTFGAGSVGWIISEEAFLKDNTILNLLKLRASYGLTGNAEIGNFASRNLYGALAYADQAGIVPSTVVGNPNLSWENTAQTDIGLEFGFFDNRISGEVDVYEKKTSELLLSRPLSYSNGYTSVTENVGSLRNRGLEVSLNTRNLDGEFKWSTNFNVSFNRNKVTSLAAPIQSQYLGSVREGQPIGVFYGRKYAGVDPENGDALYYAADGSTTSNAATAALQIVGDPNPKYTGGITNNLSFKGVDLSVLGQFVYGNDIYNAAGLYQSVNGDYFDNQTVDQLNYWTPDNRNTNVPQPRLYAGNGTQVSSRWVTGGSFFRVKNVTLGYNLPQDLVKKGSIASVRVYVSAQNLFTLTNYDGYDPEVNTAAFGAANYLIGHDFYTPPLAKTFLAGINVGF
ncbi:TonB-linked outer membrane protein, SusC/RagA family [Hymenobacter gelipurpurascens]|uniref:TonB-linked outer membrane protein, SusC/RagA family n=1 Tax=Hymenobacter gelipurpurascens TaxID=89968 RepID=A0A212U9Q2_9BACT|nr:TonB-dependent receptor [Hymenobacter gelipurpurascens]SNC74860.1 TonB-linked outer membrane protein, SusC/RagA family [Hymenobacter gelipurpurascens]